MSSAPYIPKTSYTNKPKVIKKNTITKEKLEAVKLRVRDLYKDSPKQVKLTLI